MSMKCSKCKFAKFNDKNTFRCTQPIPEMTTQCIVRNIFWTMLSNTTLIKKTEKMVDKTIEEMDEGEEWKRNKPI